MNEIKFPEKFSCTGGCSTPESPSFSAGFSGFQTRKFLRLIFFAPVNFWIGIIFRPGIFTIEFFYFRFFLRENFFY